MEKETSGQKSAGNPQGTVQHESSADNAQEIGLDKSLDTKREMRNEASHRKRHSGSDGGNQEQGNNH